MRVAIAQIDPKLGDVQANMALYEAKIREAREAQADLLLFPELSLTGYFLRDTVPDVALTARSRAPVTLPMVAGGRCRVSQYGIY